MEEVSVWVWEVVGAEVSVGVWEVVGAEVSVEALAEVEVGAEVGEESGLVGVIPMPWVGPVMVCLAVIPMGDTDMVTHTMAMAQGILTDHAQYKKKGGELCQDLMERDHVEWVQ